MEEKKFPIRYYVGAGLLLAALALPVLAKEARELLTVLIASVSLLIAGVICVLPQNRRGLWIGGGVIILLHVLSGQYFPGGILEILLTTAPPYFWYTFFVCGIGALVCLGYFFVMLVSYLDSDRPVAPCGPITKIMIIAGWPILTVSACFPKLKYELFDMTARSQTVYPALLSIIFAWAQYALFHWLLFMTITWIRNVVRKKKEQRRVPEA